MRHHFQALSLTSCLTFGGIAGGAAQADDTSAVFDLFERFQSTCNAIFKNGRSHLTGLVQELPNSFLTTSDDGHASYFVWLTDDYSQGTTVIFLSNSDEEKVTCDVSYGNYSNFDVETVENAILQLLSESEIVNISGGAMMFDQGSEEKLHEFYGTKPLRYMLVTGALELNEVALAVEINPAGTVNMTAELTQPVAH